MNSTSRKRGREHDVPRVAVNVVVAAALLSLWTTCAAADGRSGNSNLVRVFVPVGDGRVAIGGRHAWATGRDGAVAAVADWPCVTFNVSLVAAYPRSAPLAAVGVVMEGGHNDFLVFYDGQPASGGGGKLVTDDGLREHRLPPLPREAAARLNLSLVKVTEASYFVLKALLPLERMRLYGFAVYLAAVDGGTGVARLQSELMVTTARARNAKRRVEFFSDSDSNGTRDAVSMKVATIGGGDDGDDRVMAMAMAMAHSHSMAQKGRCGGADVMYWAGFGIEGPNSWRCIWSLEKYENCWEGYAALTSRWLDADYRIEAWSGKGVVKNAVGIGDPMPLYWNRSIAADAHLLTDFTLWVPDLVVILLGMRGGPQMNSTHALTSKLHS